MRVENQVSQSPEDGTAKSSTSWAARAGRQLLSQRADFSTIGASACAALVLSGLLTGGYTVLRAPLPKDVDLSDASARAAHAAAKRRALLVGLRALGTATASSAVTVGAVVGGARLLGINSAADVRTFVRQQVTSAPEHQQRPHCANIEKPR